MSSQEKRKLLIQRNEELERDGMDCKGCAGNCCTYEMNSMMVTPVEAIELMQYLQAHQKNTSELKEKCASTIKQFRLDHAVGNGKRSFLRRTYTCPFFNHTELGCPLPREVKPYGCIAYMAHDNHIKAREHCFSEVSLLEKIDGLYSEEALNEKLKSDLQLFWNKSPLPLALLDLWDKDLTGVDLGSH